MKWAICIFKLISLRCFFFFLLLRCDEYWSQNACRFVIFQPLDVIIARVSRQNYRHNFRPNQWNINWTWSYQINRIELLTSTSLIRVVILFSWLEVFFFNIYQGSKWNQQSREFRLNTLLLAGNTRIKFEVNWRVFCIGQPHRLHGKTATTKCIE